MEVARAIRPRGLDTFVARRSEGPYCSRARTREPVTFRNRAVGSVFSRIVNVASASSPFSPLAAKPTSSNGSLSTKTSIDPSGFVWLFC